MGQDRSDALDSGGDPGNPCQERDWVRNAEQETIWVSRTNREIAEMEGISAPTVIKWRNRFAQRLPKGLLDEPHPGRPRTISDEQVEAVITRTLEGPPKNATHWSTRSMAAEAQVTQNAVLRI